MKKLIILSAIAMSGFIYNTADAQIGIQVGFRFGHPRVYAAVSADAPVYDQNEQVYNNDNDFYYLPDVDAYYNINEQCYYYFDGENWISAAYLPGEYRGFDWRNARRFEVRAARPYMHNEFYRNKYNGREMENFRRGNDHFNSGYVNAGRFDRDNHERDQRFNDRGRDGFNQHLDNRVPDRFNPNQRSDYNGQRFDNRNQGGYNQQQQQGREQHNGGQQFDNRGQQGFNQSAQPGREQHNGGQQFENHDRGGNNQQAQPTREQNNGGQQFENHDRGGNNQQAQPSRDQNNGGQHSDNRGQGGNAQPANQNQNPQHEQRGGTEHFSQTSPHGGSFSQRMSRY